MNGSKNSGKDFEEKVADCYRKLGYDVKMNQNLCGFQIDLLIEKRDGGFLNQTIVECKDKKIDRNDRNQILAQQNAIHKQYPAYRWICVSSHGITPDAKTAFESAGVLFVKYADLLEDIVKPGGITANYRKEEPLHTPKDETLPKIHQTQHSQKLKDAIKPKKNSKKQPPKYYLIGNIS